MSDPATTDETSGSEASGGKTLKDRVFDALWNAMELRILTVVSPLDIKNFDARGQAVEVVPTGTQRGLFTSINLATGDIRCAVSPEYEAGGNEEMRAFHTRQVELGREIVANNLKLLGDLAGTFAELFERKGGDAGVT